MRKVSRSVEYAVLLSGKLERKEELWEGLDVGQRLQDGIDAARFLADRLVLAQLDSPHATEPSPIATKTPNDKEEKRSEQSSVR